MQFGWSADEPASHQVLNAYVELGGNLIDTADCYSAWASNKHGFESFVAIRPEYSLVAPVRAAFERELAPVCLTYGIGVLPYSPLAGGFLTGKYRRGQPLPESVRTQDNARRRTDQNYQIVETLIDVAQRLGTFPYRPGGLSPFPGGQDLFLPGEPCAKRLLLTFHYQTLVCPWH